MSHARLLVLVATLASSLDATSRLHAQLLPTAHSVLNQSSSLVAFTLFTQGPLRVKREGRFHDITGELSYDPNRPADTRVDVVVNTASVDVNDARHNELLRSHEFFDALVPLGPVLFVAGEAAVEFRGFAEGQQRRHPIDQDWAQRCEERFGKTGRRGAEERRGMRFEDAEVRG